jgi:hypothetical protein
MSWNRERRERRERRRGESGTAAFWTVVSAALLLLAMVILGRGR